jgi:hypothetical protein
MQSFSDKPTHVKSIYDLWGKRVRVRGVKHKKSSPRKLMKNRYRGIKSALSFKQWLKTQ